MLLPGNKLEHRELHSLDVCDLSLCFDFSLSVYLLTSELKKNDVKSFKFEKRSSVTDSSWSLSTGGIHLII